MDGSSEKTMRYLLGKLSAQEMAEFEAHFFADDDLFQAMTGVENDLIHSYVRGELLDSERKEFEEGYLISPARRRKVEIARAMDRYLFGDARVYFSSRKGKGPAREPEQAHFALHGWAFRFISGATALVVLAIITWLLIINHALNKQLGQLQAEQIKLRGAQQQLETKLTEITARLRKNTPNSGEQDQKTETVGPNVMAFNLAPGLPRSASTVRQLVLSPTIKLLELNLYLEDDKYSTYRASLATLAGREIWHKVGLKRPTGPQSRRVISLEIPSNMLASGDYVLVLDGVGRNGEIEQSATAYRFAILRR